MLPMLPIAKEIKSEKTGACPIIAAYKPKIAAHTGGKNKIHIPITTINFGFPVTAARNANP